VGYGLSMWDMGYRLGIRDIDIVIYHIDMVIQDIDAGYGLMIWEMTVSIWDILSLCLHRPTSMKSSTAPAAP